MDQIEALPTSKDYAALTRVVISSTWNVYDIDIAKIQRSILHIHEYLSQWLNSNKTLEERVNERVQNHEEEKVEKTETTEEQKN